MTLRTIIIIPDFLISFTRNAMLTFLVFAGLTSAYAQGTITGSSTGTLESAPSQYSYVNFYTTAEWTISPSYMGYVEVSWLSGDRTTAYAEIVWTTPGTATVILKKNGSSTTLATKTVIVSCPGMSAPTLSSAQGTTTSCTPTYFNLNAGLPSGASTARWYSASSGGSPIAESTTYQTPTLGNNTSTTYYVSSVYGSGCESSRASITVTIQPAPSQPSSAAQENAVCGSGTTMLYATPGANANTYRWYTTGGSYLAQGPYTVNVSSPTTYHVRSYHTGTGCESSAISFTVEVTGVPQPPQTNSSSVCGSGNVTISATPGTSGGSILWYNMSGSWEASTSTLTRNVSNNTTYNAHTVVSNSYGHNCLSSPTPATMYVNQLPGSPSLNAQTVCGAQTVTLTGNPGSGNSLRWYNVASGGSEISASQYVSSSTTFYASAVNNTTGCISAARSSVTITVNPLPTAPTFNYENYICDASGGTVQITASAGGNTVRWYSGATGGSPIATGAVFNTPNLSSPTTYYISSYNSSSGCESSRVAVPVNFYTRPPAPAVTGAARCGSGVVTLTASSGYSMYWTDNGIAINPNPGTSYSPSLSATKSYNVHSYTAQCTSLPATVTATINPVPSTPSLTPQTICAGSVTLSGTVGANGTSIRWYSAPSGGSPISTSQTLGTTTTFYASSYNSSTQCESSRASVVITVNPIPAQPTFSFENYICESSGSVQIVASAGGNTVRWYTASTGGSHFHTGQTFDTPVLSAPATYYITAMSSAGCESTPRVAVQVLFYTKPAKPQVSASAVCLPGNGQSANIVLTASGGSGETFQWVNNASVIVSTNATHTASSSTPGGQTFSVTAHSATCASDPQTVTATFNARPEAIEPEEIGNNIVRVQGRVTLFSPTYSKFYAADQSTLVATGFMHTTNVITVPETYHIAAFDPSTGCESVTKTAKQAPIYPLISKGSLKTDIVRTPVSLSNAAQIDAMTTLDQRVTQATHFDGLLRPVQQNLVKASQAGKDIVQPIVYDGFGRSPVQYLPYVATTEDGTFQSDHFTKQLQFYAQPGDRIANDTKPYARTIYEPSPLGRAVEQGNFGDGYQPDQGHASKIFYSYNTGATTGDVEEVRLFNSDGSSTGFYAANKLHKITSLDPDGKTIIVFVNGSGQLICKKQQLDELIDGQNVSYLQTYYIYDEAGRVKFVINPKGVSILKTNGWALSTLLDHYVYQFRYDERGRITQKKVPGQGWVKYIYDRFNRMVLMQDTILKASNNWVFFKYDNFGRTVMQGLYANTVQTTRQTMQGLVNTMYKTSNATYPPSARFEVRGSTHGYANISFPKLNQAGTALAFHNISYYDNYDFDNSGSDDFAYSAQGLPNEPVSPQSIATYLPTGGKTLILDGGANYLINYVFYDRFGRPIQSQSNNHRVLTVNSVNTTVYDFEGKVTTTRSLNSTGPDVVNRFTYDNAGKLTDVYGPSPIAENITWASPTNINISGGVLTKTSNTANWDAGVISTNYLNANEDGWVEFQAGETTTYKMCGLATSNTGVGYGTITYAIYAYANGAIIIFEGGINRGTKGTYTATDYLSVERKNGIIYYRKNNQIIYKSETQNTGPLYVDVAMSSYNATLKNIRLFRANEIKLAHYEYNDLGQLVDKKLHSTNGTDYLQSVDYRYNIRGQLTSLNNATLDVQSDVNDDTNDLFGIEYLYNTVDSGLGNTAYYNGNISATKWKAPGIGSGAQDQRSYKFTYDKANQLRAAISAVRSSTAWDKELNALNETISYDHNGNIKTLQRNQRQHQLVGLAPNYISQTMDDLVYTYNNTNGDRLLKVEDLSGNAAGFSNGANVATEFTYDGNGNVLRDHNKKISANNITYNQYGKPTLIVFDDGKRVDYLYDARGNKLRMRTLQGTSTVLTTTDYVGGMVFESGILKFYGSTEGRVVMNGTEREYQYSISDHQGNTRVVFTSKAPQASQPKATFEGDAGDQSTSYTNVNAGNIVSFSAANHTPSGIKVIRMNQTYMAGPSKSIKVYPGDKVDMEVYAYFEGSSGWGNTSTGAATFITNVAAAFGGVSGAAGESGSIYSAVNNAYGSVGMAGNQGDTRPSAYLNYILYDKDYKLLDMGWTAVPASANFAQQQMTIPTVNIKEPGYIFVYLSYESQSNQWVNFDDFKVTHTKTNVVQYNDYYPFGLSAGTSWTREGNKNDFMYNAGSEINVTTGWYDLPFRNYDPALGRFMQVDPMSVSEMATYQYASNNPVMLNDPLGLYDNAQMRADMDKFHDRVEASANRYGFGETWAMDGGMGSSSRSSQRNQDASDRMRENAEMRAEAYNAKDPAAKAAFGRKYGEEQEVWYEWMEYDGVANTQSVRVVLKPKGGSGTSGCPPGIDCDKFKFSRTDDNGSQWYTPVKTDHHIGKLLEYTKDGKVVEHDIYAKNMMDGIKRTFLEAFPIFKTEAGQELGQDVTESILEKIIRWPFPIPVPFFPENPLPDPSPGWNITPKLAPK